MSVPNSGPAASPPPPVWDAHPAGAAQVAYGGFWIRLVAYIIDAILLSIAYGMSSVLWLSAALQFVSGLNAAVFANYAIALLQERADPTRLGRVMSMYSLAFFVSMPIGYAHAGLVSDRFGPQATLIESGVLAALVGLVCLLWLKPVRTLD